MEQNASMILNRTFSPCNLFPTTFPIWKAHFWTGFGNNPPSLHSLLVDLTFPFYPKSYFIYLVALVVQMCCFFFLNLFTAVMQIPSRKLKVQGYLERAIWVIKWNLGNHWNTGLIRGWGGGSRFQVPLSTESWDAVPYLSWRLWRLIRCTITEGFSSAS